MTVSPNTKKSPWKKIILFLMGLLLIIWGFFALRPTQAPPEYLSADVVKGDIEESVMASGKVRAIKSVNVGSQVSGEVTNLYVKLGDVVQEGALIAQIDKVTQNNNLLNAQANLEQSQANLQSAQATLMSRQGEVDSSQATLTARQTELVRAQSQLQRLESLMAIDAISRREYDEALANVALAQANVKSAKIALDNAYSNVESANANIKTAKAAIKKSTNDLSTATTNLGYATIRAPITGTVVAVAAEQGTTVNSNQSAPTIVTLADLSRVRIKAQISEADVIHIKTGMPAKFNIIGSPEQKFEATITGIEPAPETISNNSSSNSAVYYIGYLDVDNHEGQFRIDMTAQVNVIINAVKDVLVVPSAALKEENGKTVVQVLQADGQAVDTEVVVGLNNRVMAEIKSGLKLGDKVVIGENKGETPKDSRRGRP